METKSEDPIHKLRLKISETTMQDQSKNNHNNNNSNNNKNGNGNLNNSTGDLSLTVADKFNSGGISDDYKNLTLNTPRTEVNNDDDHDDDEGHGDLDDDPDDDEGAEELVDFDDTGGHDQQHLPIYPYTSNNSGYYQPTHNIGPNQQIKPNSIESSDNKEQPPHQPHTQQQQQQQEPAKYKNNILNYYFNDKTVNKPEDNLSPRNQNLQPSETTYRVSEKTNLNHPISHNNKNNAVANNMQNGTNPDSTHQSTTLNRSRMNHADGVPTIAHASKSDDLTNFYANESSSLNHPFLNGHTVNNGDMVNLEGNHGDPATDFYLDMNRHRNQHHLSRYSTIPHTPSQQQVHLNAQQRRPPQTLPPLSNLGLVDMAANQYSSMAMRSNPNNSSYYNYNNQTPLPMTSTNSYSNNGHNNNYRSQLPLNSSNAGPDISNANSDHALSYPLSTSGRPDPFDALQTRRRLLNEMSQTNLRVPSNMERAAIKPTPQFPVNSIVETRLAPLGPNNLVGAALNETIVSNDVDDLIDVMAKRRIAIKKLENEMYRQHSRANSMVKAPYEDPLLKAASSQMNLRYTAADPYNSSRVGGSGPGLQSQASIPNMINSSLADFGRPNAFLSNLDYPSESNREIYSTYLVDSLRPHYSARRLLLLNGGNMRRMPGQSAIGPTAMSHHQRQTSSLNNNNPAASSELGADRRDFSITMPDNEIETATTAGIDEENDQSLDDFLTSY